MAYAERTTGLRFERCAPVRGGDTCGNAISHGIAGAQIERPRLENGGATRLLQAGEKVERGGTNRRRPEARPKAGRGHANDDGDDGQPETQLDQGEPPTLVLNAHGADSVPEVLWG